MSKTLTDEGINDAANELSVEPAVIRAVAEVESRGAGFDPDGAVKILFEKHKFHQFTNGMYDAEHPDISNRTAGGYGAGGAHQHARFSEAFQLDPDAAMKSASWGKFQIMGFNYKAAGFDSVGEFVDAMKAGEDDQLKAFVKLIKSWGLAAELRNHDWAGFARQYNGSDYKKNKYDTKLAAAYKKFKGQSPVNENAANVQEIFARRDSGPTEMKPLELESQPAKPDETTPPPVPAAEVKPGGAPATGAVSEPDAKEVRMMAMSSGSKALTIGTIGTAILGFFKEAWSSSREQVIDGGKFALAHLPMTLAIIALAALGVYVWNTASKRRDERMKQIVDVTSDKTKNDVVIT